MKFLPKLALTLAVAAAGIVGTALPAAARDVCNGVYEVDGCEYCSYRSDYRASSTFYCDYGYPGYGWNGCNFWVNGTCIEGAIN